MNAKALLLFFIFSAPLVSYPYFMLVARNSGWFIFNVITFSPAILAKDGRASNIVLNVRQSEDYWKFSLITDYYNDLKNSKLQIKMKYKLNGKPLNTDPKFGFRDVNQGYLQFKTQDLTNDCDDDKHISATIDDISRNGNGFDIAVSITCTPSGVFDKLQQNVEAGLDEINNIEHYNKPIKVDKRAIILV